jgi:hypothetical protein
MNLKMRDGQMKFRSDITLYLTIDDLSILQTLSKGIDHHRFLEDYFYKLIEDSKPKETPKEETPKETSKKGRLLKKTTN